MLCRFAFKNFMSYRDETVFDMQADDNKELSDSLIPAPGDNFEPLLPVSTIFGPNAGGKSNVLKALSYLLSRVLMPIKASKSSIKLLGVYLQQGSPFLLDDVSKANPTEFEVFFRTASAQYQYQLILMGEDVVEEYLYSVKTPCERRKYVKIFERDEDGIRLGSAIKKANTQQISSAIPYLSFLAINYNFQEIEDVINWFMRCCFIDYGVRGSDHRIAAWLCDEDIKPLILTLLSSIDIPISNYELLKDTNEEGQETRRLVTTHTVNGQDYSMNLRDESEGTIKILSAIPYVIDVLTQGGVLLVDELDAKLHPRLLRAILNLYTTPEINIKHAQLIFTCHDLTIMRSDILRRDEICFAAQNEDSASELWSLYDIRDEQGGHIKTSAAYDKQYLAGRYGADPYLKRIISWGQFNGKESETT